MKIDLAKVIARVLAWSALPFLILILMLIFGVEISQSDKEKFPAIMCNNPRLSLFIITYLIEFALMGAAKLAGWVEDNY